MSTINPSAIDITKPEAGSATTASVRANEAATQTQLQNAKNDIEALEPHPGRTDNPHGVTAAQAGADPAGTAAAAVSAHEAAGDPHSQYLTQAEGDSLYDATGTATAAVAAHEAAPDPHGQYLTQAEGDAAYTPLTLTGDGELLTRAVGIHAKIAPGTDNQLLTMVSGQPEWVDPPVTISGYPYRFSTNTNTSQDPGSGSFRANAASFAAITRLAMDDQTSSGVNVRDFLLAFKSGDRVGFRSDSDPTEGGTYSLSSDPISQTGFVQLDVTYISDQGGGLPSNNSACHFLRESAGGGGGGEDNTSSNAGAGAGLALAKSGVDLPFRSLVSGDASVTFTELADTMDIRATGAGGGEANDGTNLGLGAGVFAQKNGVNLEFKSLQLGDGINISPTATAINIAVDGTVARLNMGNTFTGAPQLIQASSGGASLRLSDETVTANQRMFAMLSAANVWSVDAMTDAGAKVGNSLISFGHRNSGPGQGVNVGVPTGGFLGADILNVAGGIRVNNVSVSLEGHTHTLADITDSFTIEDATYQDDKAEAGATVNLALTGSPRVVVSNTGAVTINPPGSGEGSLEVIVDGPTGVSLGAFTRIFKTQGTLPQVAYVTRTSTQTYWAWGPDSS